MRAFQQSLFFFPVWDKRYDTGDPANSGLYGQFHLESDKRVDEVIYGFADYADVYYDKYEPATS
jgi:hypothetical protein